MNGPTSSYEELGEDAVTRGFGRQFPHDPTENDFVFGAGDQVLLLVEEEEPKMFSGEYVIRQDGKITLPLVNDVLAGGLTPDQLRRKLEGRLRMYMHDPKVTVAPGLIVSRRFYVAAPNLTTGGTVIFSQPYKGDTTLFDVFVAMGSPSSLMDDDTHVKVIRGDPRNPRVLTVNMRELYTKGYTGGNIQIQPDDIVYVPPTLLGRFNSLISGLAIPINNLFRASITYWRGQQLLQGDAVGTFRRGGVYF